MRKTVLFILLLAGISQISFAQNIPGMPHKNGGINVPKGVPKNIILVIVDGMGVAQVSAADIKSKHGLRFAEFPRCGFIKTWNKDGEVPDDAADYTAIATGQKVPSGYTGISANGDPVKNLFEWAKGKNMLTGLVTTAPLTDPTNVALALHEIPQTTQDQEALDYLKTDFDILIGGANKYFQKRTDKRNLIPDFMKKGYNIETKLGRVDNINVPKTAALLNEQELYRAKARGSFLKDAALSSSRAMINGYGYLLVINNTKVRDAAEVNDLDFVSEEVQDVDAMAGKLLDYMKNDDQTLIIVMGSGEVGGLVVNGFNPKKKNVQATWLSKTKTANLAPVFANGPGSENFSGIYDNTQIFQKIIDLLQMRP